LSSEYDSENGQLTHLQNSSSSASVAICSTYVYASYMVDNRDAVSVLADKTVSISVRTFPLNTPVVGAQHKYSKDLYTIS